uniref:Uncharacterized protein n=1 Tax=Laticauda laticaudata TaxID=8630 RepID=A0A8C5RHP6_LATLA
MCLFFFQEKSASSHVKLKANKELPGLVHQPRANMHISESQQEFFRMLDEKIEKEFLDQESCLISTRVFVHDQIQKFCEFFGRNLIWSWSEAFVTRDSTVVGKEVE